MQRLSRLDLMQRAIRAAVCTQCHSRPKAGFAPGFAQAGPCEAQCAVFDNIWELARIAADSEGDPQSAYDRMVQQCVCQKCTRSASAGDYCADRLNRSCPLSRYAGTAVEALEHIDSHRRGAE